MALSPATEVEYIDLPDLQETFVDSVRIVHFDGMTMRAELCVTRIEDREPVTVKRYPACRLVMTQDAALYLFKQLQQIVTAMEQRGKLKRERTLSPADVLQNPLGARQKPE
jgi:hypothetical protein